MTQRELPRRNPGKGALILILCAIILLAATRLELGTVEDLPLWLIAVALAGALVVYYWVYRGFRLLIGSGIGVSLLLTLVAFPILIGMASPLLPEIEGARDMIASLSKGDDDDGTYFSGVTAKNTSAAELDDLLEEW